jgi:hypothetical protein
MSWLLILIQ